MEKGNNKAFLKSTAAKALALRILNQITKIKNNKIRYIDNLTYYIKTVFFRKCEKVTK